MSEKLSEKPLVVLEPQGRLLNFGLRELWSSRELIGRFVHRDFVSSYKQTVLGPLWFVIPPLATTLIFTVVFGRIAKIPTAGVPDFLFFMISVVLWNFFASCLTKTSTTFTGNAGLFGKVYIPRLSVPVSLILSNLLTMMIQLAIFVGFYGWFLWRGSEFRPGWEAALFPLILLQLAMLGLGLGCIISSMTTYYRDFAMMVGFGVQLWMYGSAVMYPVQEVPEAWQSWILLNPVVPVVELSRHAFFGTGHVYWGFWGVSWAVTLVVLIFGLVVFRKMERTFMDTV